MKATVTTTSVRRWRTDNETGITKVIASQNRFEYGRSDKWKQVKKDWWKQFYNLPVKSDSKIWADNNFAKHRQLKENHCYCCVKTNSVLHLHHLSYKNYYGKELFKDLIPLCNQCHKILHEYAYKSGFIHGCQKTSLHAVSMRFIKYVDLIKKKRDSEKRLKHTPLRSIQKIKYCYLRLVKQGKISNGWLDGILDEWLNNMMSKQYYDHRDNEHRALKKRLEELKDKKNLKVHSIEHSE